MVKISVVRREIELIDLCYKMMELPKNYIVEENYLLINNNDLENLDIMFNCILDTFLNIGLLDNDEPNEVGIELERLNQKINHEYVKLNR